MGSEAVLSDIAANCYMQICGINNGEGGSSPVESAGQPCYAELFREINVQGGARNQGIGVVNHKGIGGCGSNCRI